MPHIDIQCYPKGLSQQDLQAFADALTAVASERLHTPAKYITIAYTEIPEHQWKEKVFDTKIKPHAATLLRTAQYEMSSEEQ